MRLWVIDCDPAQTERIRAWRKASPGWELTWVRGHLWRLSDGRSEFTGLGWGEALHRMERLSRIALTPRPGRTAPDAVAAARPVPGELPDIIA